MWWTLLAVVLVVVCFLFIVAGPTFAGRKSLGQGEEMRGRLWTGLWKREDADRFR